MGHNRPLFELIIEESRSTARESKLSHEFTPSPRPRRSKLHKTTKLGGWFTRPKKAPSLTASPTPCSTPYESAHDTLSFNFNFIEDWQEGQQLGLPCLQDEGERYLEMAMALDMMELRVSQACAERDVALSQSLDLRFAIDSIRNRLHEVEQYCMHLNYQLFMESTSQKQAKGGEPFSIKSECQGDVGNGK